VSHLKERKEKQCLNCNAVIYGRFCHVCGQENLEPKEPFLHLVTHFIYDIVHFDGKFFDTLRYLILRPGFLAYEYMRGRRNSYLNPIRMYIFTSAIFFLIYFSVNKKEHAKDGDATHTVESADNHDKKGGLFSIGDSIKANFKENFEKEHVIDSLESLEDLLTDSIETTNDEVVKEQLIAQKKTVTNILKISKSIIGNTDTHQPKDSTHGGYGKTAKDTVKANRYVYKPIENPIKSGQKKPANATAKTKNAAVEKHSEVVKKETPKKDVVVEDILLGKTKEEAHDSKADTTSIGGVRIISNNKAGVKKERAKAKSKFEGFLIGLADNREELLHKLPQVMFITLPFMALMLRLLYRRLKQFYYVNHIIFIINLYIGVYLLILLEMGIDYLHDLSHFRIFALLSSIVSLGTFFYVYKSLRNFYHQGRIKTLLKCFLLYFLFFIIAVISFLAVAALPFSLSH
jgi:Protein of unknown function (DUF3667)